MTPTEPSPKAAGDNELLPCPFCGGEATVENIRNKQWRAWCLSHDCDVNIYRITKRATITAWNTRTPPATGEGERLVERQAYYRAWDIARGTNADLCKTPLAAYRLIVGELRKLVSDGPAPPLRASPDQEVERAFREGFALGDFAGGGQADPRTVDLAWSNSRARQALTTQEDHRNG